MVLILLILFMPFTHVFMLLILLTPFAHGFTITYFIDAIYTWF